MVILICYNLSYLKFAFIGMPDTNLTKKNRAEMIEFLEKIKSSNKDDETLKMVNKIENFITEKKFWLVFEEHREEVDDLLQTNIPVLCEDAARRICKDESLPWNFIIEWDNLQALYLLLKTHKWKINVIYIDPPYNTWAKDWKYNNNYVDINDGYRHSKWLSMMKVRLELAKDLLSEDGCLICAIDENELNTVWLLLKDIFNWYYIDCIAIVHNPWWIQWANFSYCHEYAYFVYPHTSYYINKEKRNEDWELTPFRDWGKENSKRQWSPNCFYPIIVKNWEIIGFWDVPDDSFSPKSANEIKDDCIYVWPIDKNWVERRWRFARNTVEEIKDELVPVDISWVLNIQRQKEFYTRKTVWDDAKYSANIYWTQLLSSILWSRFSYPKSLYQVKECIEACIHSKDATILDFFAWSWTTMHAVTLMNAEDWWNRKCIMVTNNEISAEEEKVLTEKWYKKWDDEWEKLWIARYVTWPRMECVINWVDINWKPLEWDYWVEKEIYKVDEDSVVVSKTSWKPLKTKLYKKTKIQLYPKLAEIKKSDWFKMNLKYFKCDWTPRKPEDYYLSNVLLLHVKEMIELENAVEIDNVKNVAILNKDDYKKYILDDKIYDNIENIWVNQKIIFDSSEFKKIEAKNYRYIPTEYFWQELKDNAE